MTYNVLMGTLNPTHSRTHSLYAIKPHPQSIPGTILTPQQLLDKNQINCSQNTSDCGTPSVRVFWRSNLHPVSALHGVLLSSPEQIRC